MYENELAQSYEATNPVVEDMASVGRKGDTMMAHVTPGDYVIPKDILVEHPEFLTKLKKVMADKNTDYRDHMVGSGYENINPETGAPEFGFGSRLRRITRRASRPLGRIPVVNRVVPAVANIAADVVDASPGSPVMKGFGTAQLRGVAEGASAPMPPYERGDEAAAQPYQPEEMQLPTSLAELGGLTDVQRRAYLATEGAQGSGLGGQARDYYINLLQRNIAAEQGDLLPIESQYLSTQGIGGELRGQALIDALRGL